MYIYSIVCSNKLLLDGFKTKCCIKMGCYYCCEFYEIYIFPIRCTIYRGAYDSFICTLLAKD